MANNNVALEKKKALDLIQDSARNYLSAKLTLPLGNPDLKKVHTNQFLWTELPEEFSLKNWGVIAEVLGSSWTRYSGYEANRWYVEAVTIDVERKGKAEMSLDLNAFASSTSSYTEGYRSMVKAYQDAQNKNSTSTTTGKTTSSNKSTSNATTKTSVINQDWVKKYNVPSKVVNIIKSICSVNKSDYDNVYAWYKWMDNHVGYVYYTNHQREINTVLNMGSGNCVDNSRVFRAGCHALGIKCNYVHGFSCCSGSECANHQWNLVYINGKKYTVDCGRSYASWGSHWGSCSGGSSESTSSW